MDYGQLIDSSGILLTMALKGLETAPASPTDERSLAVNFFRAQLEKIKSGKIKRYDLVTFARDWEGQVNLFSPAQRIIHGVKLFSETEIKAGAQQLLNELTGETDGWGMVDGITLDKPDKRDTSHSHHDVLTWGIPTLVDKVKIGVDKVVDDRGEWARTYYLFHSRA